jgi:hypothetical protein
MDARVAQALVRFGLGRRGQESLPSDPIAWLQRQLTDPEPRLPGSRPSTANGLAALRDDRINKPEPGQRRGPVLYLQRLRPR